jgi:hypothetical protein
MNLRIPAADIAKKVTRMLKRKSLLGALFFLAFSPAAFAQINCGASGASNKLSCLIPATVTPSGFSFSNSTAGLGSLSNSFGFLTSDIGGEISQIPLASPASGIIYTNDPTLHVPVPSDQSLGPILTQRADTIGRHKVYVAATYQYFLLKDVDGLALSNLPSAFLLQSSGATSPDTLGVANGDIQLKIHQFVGYFTYGLTSRIDVSAAVPILRVDMRYTVNELFYNLATGAPPVGGPASLQTTKAGEATGVGDIILAAKGTVWKFKRGGGLAMGAELRVPSGDALNFLGSGTTGVKPFAGLTIGGTISPHFNIGYQVNGHTVLQTIGNGTLPNRLIYSGGADWRVASRLTIAADVLEQRIFTAPRASLLTNVTIPGTSILVNSAIATSQGTYNRTDGSIGLKLKPVGNLLVTGNLLVKLDRNGLRERIAPLVGLSYTF